MSLFICLLLLAFYSHNREKSNGILHPLILYYLISESTTFLCFKLNLEPDNKKKLSKEIKSLCQNGQKYNKSFREYWKDF